MNREFTAEDEPMAKQATQIDQYAQFQFKAATRERHEIEHTIYHRGQGAPVVLIQELPGIGQETLQLADELVNAGFEVVMPHLFGPIGKTSMVGNLARVFCMRREFTLFAANQSSPMVDWLKALCQHIRTDRGVSGVGAIGMCLTGNFAISLMADDSVLATVASQPAMPIAQPNAIHMSAEEVEQIKERIDVTAPIKAYRFEKDPLSDARKFQCLHDALNTEGHNRIDLQVLPGKGHSVLTLDFVDEIGHPTRAALDDILAYFSTQLK